MSTNESSPNSYDAQQVADYWSAPGAARDFGRAWTRAAVAVGAWVVSISLILIVPLFMIIPYMVHVAVKVGTLDQATLASDKAVLFLSILGVIPAHLLTFALIWLIVTYAGQVPFSKAIGLEWPKSIGPVWGVALCALMALALWAVGIVVTYYFGEHKTDLDLLVESSIQARWATAFVAFFTAPIVEESLYRGLIYPSFERALSPLVGRGLSMAFAIVGVSVLFAGVHVFQYRNNLAVISVITLLSVTLTLVRALSGKLMPCFVIHLVFNGIQSVLLIVTTKSDVPTPPPTPSLAIFSDLIRFLS